MTRKLIIALLWGTLSLSFAQADTIIPGGYVSGTWTLAGSPYQVQGNITIHGDSTLNIEPGVLVNFLGGSLCTVNGWLESVGTEADSIYFAGGNGFDFQDAPDSSHLVYCSMIIPSIPVRCNNSNPVISHSSFDGFTYAIYVINPSSPRISNCLISNTATGILWGTNASATISGCIITDTYDGGVRKTGGNLTFIDCNISNNKRSGGPGGGVSSSSGNVSFIDCTISNDTSYWDDGGGVSCYNGTATFTNCTIKGNYAQDLGGSPYIGGGGISLYNANAILSYCTIFDNIAVPHGGAISIYNSGNLSIDHCTIDGNEADCGMYPGSAIVVLGSSTTADITNSIISNNYSWTSSGRAIYTEGTLTVEYSDFYHNYPGGDISGNIPTGFGVLDSTNTNGDSCDVYNNIFLDAMYADTANYDYHLTEGSPCIDAGDPTSPHDPDSTIADIGRYFFDQRMPDIELSASLLDFGAVTIGASADLPLTIYNIGGDTLALYDLACDLSVFTTNWNPSDSLVLPGDSLEITLTFAPEDSGSYLDTLCIENNCELCGVELLGHGEALGVSDPISGIPREFALRGPYPNPFNPMTNFRIELPVASRVKLEIYDISGKSVATVLEGWRAAGYHDVSYDGSGLTSGVYLYRLNAADFTASGKMVLMK